MRYLSIVLAAVLLTTGITLNAGEAKSPEALKIDALVKDLGDDNFEKRQNAEKELLNLGAAAEAALKAAEKSTDPQVKGTVAKLLGKIQILKLNISSYLDVFPATSMMLMQLSGPQKTWENIKTTALGKVLLSESLAPFRSKIEAILAAQGNAKQQAETWYGRFNGQLAGAVWDYQFPTTVKAAVVAEVTDGNPKAALDELLMLLNFTGGGAPFQYKGVDIIEGNDDVGAITLLGKHLVLGANLASVKEVVDGFFAPGNFAKSANFIQLKPVLNTNADVLFCFDFPSYVKTISTLLPLIPSMAEVFSDPELKNLRMLSYTSATKNGSFEDHFIVGVADATRLYGTSAPPADGEPPLMSASLVPANAVGAMIGFVNGKELKKNMQKSLDQAAKAGAPAAGAAGPLETLRSIEAQAGVKIADLAAHLQGEYAYWASLTQQGLAPPDMGVMLTCVDPDNAKQFSEAVAKMLNAVKGTPAVRYVTYRNRTINEIDLQALGTAIPPRFPYSPCWTVEDKRIYFASSTQMLQKHLINIDNKAAGLLTHPEFVKALGTLRQEERRGSIMYADVRSLMTLGATVGLPMLQTIADEELQKALATLPAPSELFKDIPPLLGATYVHNNLAQTVIRGPLPPMPTFMALIAAAVGVASQRGALPGRF